MAEILHQLIGTLPETNSSPLKMDGWNTSFLLGNPIFRGELLVLGSVVFPIIYRVSAPSQVFVWDFRHQQDDHPECRDDPETLDPALFFKQTSFFPRLDPGWIPIFFTKKKRTFIFLTQPMDHMFKLFGIICLIGKISRLNFYLRVH